MIVVAICAVVASCIFAEQANKDVQSKYKKAVGKICYSSNTVSRKFEVLAHSSPHDLSSGSYKVEFLDDKSIGVVDANKVVIDFCENKHGY